MFYILFSMFAGCLPALLAVFVSFLLSCVVLLAWFPFFFLSPFCKSAPRSCFVCKRCHVPWIKSICDCPPPLPLEGFQVPQQDLFNTEGSGSVSSGGCGGRHIPGLAYAEMSQGLFMAYEWFYVTCLLFEFLMINLLLGRTPSLRPNPPTDVPYACQEVPMA